MDGKQVGSRKMQVDSSSVPLAKAIKAPFEQRRVHKKSTT